MASAVDESKLDQTTEAPMESNGSQETDSLFGALEHFFSTKLQLVASSQQCNHISSKHTAALQDAENSVASLEQTMSAIQDYVFQEESMLAEAEQLEARLKSYQADLLHIEANLPALLQQQSPQSSSALADEENLPPSDTNAKTDTRGGKSEKGRKKGRRKALQPPPVPELTAEEFEAVPVYMKGRLQLDKVNAAILDIEQVLATKYKLLSLPVGKMNEKQLKKYKAYKDLENQETKNTFFFSDDELSSDCKVLHLDTTGKAILTILRHTGRIRNARGSGTRRYIVCP